MHRSLTALSHPVKFNLPRTGRPFLYILNAARGIHYGDADPILQSFGRKSKLHGCNADNIKKENEETKETKARRLLWQSRSKYSSVGPKSDKRNDNGLQSDSEDICRDLDLLLSTWFERNHKRLSSQAMDEYDRLINAQVNKYDLFHWISRAKPTPREFDNETMWALQDNCANQL